MNETAQTTFSVPSPGELEQLTELHKAMGDYTRMRILWYLMQKDSCVSELAQKMEVTESAISHQLRALRIVRLVQSRKAGKNVIYSLQDEHIRWIRKALIDRFQDTEQTICFQHQGIPVLQEAGSNLFPPVKLGLPPNIFDGFIDGAHGEAHGFIKPAEIALVPMASPCDPD